jgi:hypothetical protein
MKTFQLIIIILLASLSLQSHAQEEDFSKEKQSSNVKYTLFIEDAVCLGIRHSGIEKIVMNGISIHEKHVIGFGMGLGLAMHGIIAENTDIIYCPLYLNYRYYFKTGSYSPFLNFSLGGTLLMDSESWYSSFTVGFRKHKFTFSSGVFFHAYQYSLPLQDNNFHPYPDPQDDNLYEKPFAKKNNNSIQEFPLGLIVKLGVAF